MEGNVTVPFSAPFSAIAENPEYPGKSPEQIRQARQTRELIYNLVKCGAFDEDFLTTAIVDYYEKYGGFA